MLKINITSRLKYKCPQIALGAIQFNAVVKEKDGILWLDFVSYIDELTLKLENINLKELEEIKAGRIAYKKLGRDPDRYNLSSEALLKRIKAGKEVYQVNNLVDLNNYISVQSNYSIGLYDLDKTKGSISFDYGSEKEVYESLAKGIFDVYNLPVFRDSISSFGSPTSDSKRTAINLYSQKVLMVLISFTGEDKLSYWQELTTKLLLRYSCGTNLKTSIIK